MGISFPNIPASGLLIPGFFAEFDNSRAGYGTNPRRALLIGQPVETVDAVPVLLTTADAAAVLFGDGSQLARMVAAYRANDPFGEVWALPIADGGSGVAAEGALAVTGTASAAGTLALYIGGQLCQVGVTSGQTAAQVAAAIAAAINAMGSLPVTAEASSATVTITAKNAGTVGNDIDLRLNYRGAAGGETTPAGVAVTITAMTGGATDPVTTGLDAILTEIEFDFIALGWSGATHLDNVKALMDDATGRWSYLRQVYGHAFAARRDTAGNLATFGALRNDPHATVLGIHDTPTPGFEIAAALAAVVAVSIKADAARPLQTLPLRGVKAPPMASRFAKTTQNTLLGAGIALSSADADGTVRILRCVTTYQRNAAGMTDRSYLDVETLYTLTEVVRRLRAAVTQKFARSKLADDGTRFGPGQPIVTPGSFKAELVAQYGELEADGLVENVAAFAEATVVQRNAGDPSRLDVLFAPDLVNGLRVLALLVQFRS